MSLKVITIDFWSTLFDNSNGVARNAYRQGVLKTQIENVDHNLTDADFDAALRASWEFFHKIWRNEFRTPTTDETVGFYWNYLNLPYDEEKIEIVSRAFADCILEYPPALLPGVKEALETLNTNFKLGLISDTGFSPGSVLIKLMREVGIDKYFSAFSFSDETGVSKPHPKAYHTILEELTAAPEEALHIGDIEQTDIEGAKQLGMKAILFKGDPTGGLAPENDEPTKADYEVGSWDEVVEIIRSIRN